MSYKVSYELDIFLAMSVAMIELIFTDNESEDLQGTKLLCTIDFANVWAKQNWTEIWS